MNRAERRKQTQRQQREAKGHFHPRELARAVVHNRIARQDIFGANKVRPGQTQSNFAKNWRTEADMFATGGK